MDRMFSVVGENLNRYKIAMGLLLTQRGIPQMYYGDEVLMKNLKNPSDAAVREDFLGGWNTDAVNKFTTTGRNQQENEAFNYIKTIANFRKKSKALQMGKLIQYMPKDEVYVYARMANQESAICFVHTGNKPIVVDLKRFAEGFGGKKLATNIVSGKTFEIGTTMQLEPLSIVILDLK
jgi:glycosidase